MLDIGFPRHWSTLKKLMWLKAATGESPAYETASGAVASFEAKRAAPLQSLIVNIDPVQSGTGDPSPDNVRPITGWANCAVNHGQPINPTIYSGSRLDSSTGGLISASSYKYTDYIPVVASTTMRVSYHMPSGSWYFTACYYDSAKSHISSYQKMHSSEYDFVESLSIPATCAYVRFSLKSTYTNLTVYASFTTKTIQFPTPPGTVYGGTLDVLTGVLTVDRASYIFDGSSDEGWTASNGCYCTYFFGNAIKRSASTSSTAQIVICDTYKNGGVKYRDYVANGTIVKTVGANNQIALKDTAYASTAAFVAHLQEAPIQVVYQLATPQTYQLTPQEINALKGQNNIWADTGDVSVTYRSN